jgi:hypothetical protein
LISGSARPSSQFWWPPVLLTWRVAARQLSEQRASRFAPRNRSVGAKGVQAREETSAALWDFESDLESVYFTRRLIARRSPWMNEMAELLVKRLDEGYGLAITEDVAGEGISNHVEC